MKFFILILAIVVLFVHTESKVHFDIFLQYFSKLLLNTKKGKVKTSERPIIGIWTQPINSTHDYIVAAYVKFAEMAGA